MARPDAPSATNALPLSWKPAGIVFAAAGTYGSSCPPWAIASPADQSARITRSAWGRAFSASSLARIPPVSPWNRFTVTPVLFVNASPSAVASSGGAAVYSVSSPDSVPLVACAPVVGEVLLADPGGWLDGEAVDPLQAAVKNAAARQANRIG